MKSTTTGTAPCLESDNTVEETALTHFMKVHEHLSFESAPLDYSVEAEKKAVSLHSPKLHRF